MPVYDMIEVWLKGHNGGVEIGFWTRFVYRSAYTCFTAFIAILAP